MGILRRASTCCIAVLLLFTLSTFKPANAQSDEELSNVLEQIFSPESKSSMHARVLRRDIVRRLYDALQREDLEDELLDYKRSINSLARWGHLPGKRNLAALAKGGYIRTIPIHSDGDQQQDDEQDKRSLASLARSGQLPMHVSDLKRNLGSIMRSYSLPAYGKRYLGALMRNSARYTDEKRNVAALARDGFSGMSIGKRNVAALLRQDKIHGPNDRSYDNMDEQMEVANKQQDGDDDSADEAEMQKRNVGAAKANGYKPPVKRSVDATNKSRSKREVDYYNNYEFAVPVYQNENVRDYEDMMNTLTGEYPPEKRFLGRLPQMGKSKTTPSPKVNYE